MQTITKDDFLSMVKLQHLEVLTSDQLKQNTEIIKGYMEKALTSELSELEKADSNEMIAEIGELQQWCVLRDDFSKAAVYTRREQIAWDDPERGEFGEILKARGGIYKQTAVNKKLGRVGQKYGEAHDHVKQENDIKKLRSSGELDKFDNKDKQLPVDETGFRHNQTKKFDDEMTERHKTMPLKEDKVLAKRKELLGKQGGKKFDPKTAWSEISGNDRTYIHSEKVNLSRKPLNKDDIDVTEVTPQLQTILDKLTEVELKSNRNFLDDNLPDGLAGGLFVAKVGDKKYLIDTQGYDYARYVTELKEDSPEDKRKKVEERSKEYQTKKDQLLQKHKLELQNLADDYNAY
jgi:hypothetical protein